MMKTLTLTDNATRYCGKEPLVRRELNADS